MPRRSGLVFVLSIPPLFREMTRGPCSPLPFRLPLQHGDGAAALGGSEQLKIGNASTQK